MILVCVILWGIYVAVRAQINLNERFIDAVSNPAGIIGLFFGLLTVFAILLRFFI
ncbi:TPA: GIY-YIG nuclease family protein, partial [Escherichia coli]